MKQCLQPLRIASSRGTDSCRRDGARARLVFRRSWLAATTAALLLAACGGGGDAPPAAAAYAVNAAQRHLLTDGGSWIMNGTGPNGQAFAVTMTYAPLPPAAFPLNGNVAARSLETFTVQVAGQSDSATQTIYFDPANLAFVGAQSDGACGIATSSTALPTSAALGANGTFYVGSELNGCTGASSIVATTTISWSLEADRGVVLLCWNLAFKDAAGTLDGTQSNCVEVDPDGHLGTRARFAVSASGLSITARNF